MHEVNLLINQAVHATSHFYLVTFCWFKYANYKLNGYVTSMKKDGRLSNEAQICEVCSNNFHVFRKQEHIRRNLPWFSNLSAYLRTLYFIKQNNSKQSVQNTNIILGVRSILPVTLVRTKCRRNYVFHI
jgi:hypothetical protein